MDRLALSGVVIRSAQKLLLCMLILLAHYSIAEDLAITQVSVSPNVITADAPANIRFSISKPGNVIVKVFNAVDALIWSSESIKLPAGVHAIAWSGRSAQGNVVAPEAYFFVIEAQAEPETNGRKKGKPQLESTVYDLTDITGGENLRLDNIRYDSTSKKLTFVAPKTGRYILRAGIARAFAINTLINNNVVQEGEHEITWDGYDTSRVYNSATHPQLVFGGVGYQLSSNAIVVLPQKEQISSHFQTAPLANQPDSSEYRESKKVMRANTSPNYYRSVSQSRDVPLVVDVPKSLKRNKNDAYIIQQPIPVRIDLLPADIMVMEAQRGEIVLFLDGQLIHDNEVSYYPYTFNWDPKIYDGKEHLLTVFVAGFAGNIGMSTLKVQLNPL